MKEIQKYRIKRAFGVYRVGDIIQPTNAMWRDELKTNGWIEKYVEPTVEPEPEPAPVDDISDDEDDVLTETAVVFDTLTADLPRGRRGRHGR